MKLKFQATAFFLSLLGVASAQNYVTLYTDCDYRGGSQMFKPGTYSLNGTRIGGGNLSSARVPAGMKLIIYTDANPGNGQKTRITNDISCLTSISWNDRAYSIAVEKEDDGYVTNLPGNQQVPNNNNMATLYENCNYGGRWSSLSAGYHDWNGLGIPNDALSSLRLPGGWSITLYENSGYKGRSTTYNGSINCLPADWNDRVSSVIVSSTGGGGNNNNNNNNSGNNNNNWGGGVTLFQDCNYRGNNSMLGTGYYNWNQLGIDNDQLSSFRVPAGYSITLYTDANYRGRRISYNNDVNCLSGEWNDQISSVYVTYNYNNSGNNNNTNINNNWGSVILYEDENFGGRSVSLGAGSYAYLPNAGFSENTLSSLQLPRGWKVVLYDQPNFRGNSYTVLRTKDRFNISGWGDRASSLIIYTSGGSY